MNVSAVALFCDDIREEKSGAVTVIGIMPDNVEVPSLPGMLPRVAIYIRIHLDIGLKPEPLEVFLTFPDGNQHKLIDFSKNMIEDTAKEAASTGNTLVGLFANAVASPFPVPAAGRAIVTLKRGDETQVIGGLNIVVTKASDPSATSQSDTIR